VGRSEAANLGENQPMDSIIVNSEFEFLDKALSDVNLENKVVLDAGTGSRSTGFLAQREPGKLVCVAAPGDTRKEEEARDRLEAIGYGNYQIILGNLASADLFPSNSFDFILAHYLIQSVDGFAPLGVYEVLCSLYKYLRQEGELAIVEPDAYAPFRPEYELTSTYEFLGDAQLGKRSNRELIDTLLFLVMIPVSLRLLSPSTEGRYPSKWIYNWLTNVGFIELEKFSFDIKMYVDKEFTHRAEFTRQMILKMCPPKLRDGLLEKLEEVVSEYKRRRVAKDDFFLQRHYAIRARKG
jgi:SAM-dependent methyltransferase